MAELSERAAPAVLRILVATDFSDISEAAARAAHAHARRAGGRLHLLHVARTVEAYAAAAAALSGLSADLGPDVPVLTSVRLGTPADEVVRYAREEEIDLLFLGTHGHTGVSGVLLGSVAERVARTAPCPVVLVPREAAGPSPAMPRREPQRCLACGVPSEGLFCDACRARFRALGAPPHWIAPEGALSGALTPEQIEKVLAHEIVGRLGCHAGGRTYVVPIGYVFAEGSLYFRSGEGLKVQMMREDPAVCFQVDHIEDLANWQSVILWGTFQELSGREAAEARRRIWDRLTSLFSDQDIHPSPSRALENSALGHRAHALGRNDVIGRIAVKEATGRFERR